MFTDAASDGGRRLVTFLSELRKMRIVQTNRTDSPRHDELVRGLVDYNDRVGPPAEWEWIAFYAEDDEGNFLGGLQGNFEWDYLFVKRLWVAEPGKGLGRVLLNEAEAEARRRGKKGVWLDTYEFQARGFYEKEGYTVFGTIPGAAGDHARYFLRKQFDSVEEA
jgi:GNAT superfamily N-acetyltransferase